MSTHLWSRLSSVKWEDAWVERLRFAGERNLVIRKFPASRSIRLDLYTDAATARKVKEAFGGTIRPFDLANWTPPAPKKTAPCVSARALRIYGDEERFRAERSSGRGKALFIPSGLAFGTGDHATTARCLQLLVDATNPLQDKEWSLLDLGCGSGILALAGELLGALRILGCDFDERCVKTSKENAVLNDLTRSRFVKADVLRWTPTKSAGKPAVYDIVAANLYSTILTAAAPMIMEAIKPGGLLILSGILSVEESALKKTFSALRHQETLRRGKWSAMMFPKEIPNMNSPVILITGATRGIGFAAARELKRREATVLLGSRDPERARKAAAEIGAEPIPLDITQDQSIADAVALVEARHGRLDVPGQQWRDPA